MHATLGQQVYSSCHLDGSFMLRSGQVSNEYFDKYLFEGQPALLRDVARAMAALLPECDVLAGDGRHRAGHRHVTAHRLPSVFVRKEAKGYGTQKAAEGGSVDGMRVVGIEDVVTTGGALVKGCLELVRKSFLDVSPPPTRAFSPRA